MPSIITINNLWLIHYANLSCALDREDIMALQGQKEKILEMIAELPLQMEAADIHDFCSLAVLYSAQTPYSYKRVYITNKNTHKLRLNFKQDLIILSRVITRHFLERKYRRRIHRFWSCRKLCASLFLSKSCSSVVDYWVLLLNPTRTRDLDFAFSWSIAVPPSSTIRVIFQLLFISIPIWFEIISYYLFKSLN